MMKFKCPLYSSPICDGRCQLRNRPLAPVGAPQAPHLSPCATIMEPSVPALKYPISARATTSSEGGAGGEERRPTWRQQYHLTNSSEGAMFTWRLGVVSGTGELKAVMRVLPWAPAEPLLADDLHRVTGGGA